MTQATLNDLIGSPADASRADTTPKWVASRLLLCWLAAGLMIFALLNQPSTTRSQEARVLETAREMLGAPFQQWMLPRVNGHPRMQKPPLAYWLTAGSYKLFGVSEAAGRVPAAASAWMTVGLAMLVARQMFGPRAALFTAATMTGGMLFFRHARLAETDILVAFFVTAGVYAMWRAVAGDRNAKAWFHAAALSMALATMSKGPGAIYPFLFLIAVAAIERRWGTVMAFLRSGALVTFLAIALPWFVYVALRPEAGALLGDLENSARGGKGHFDWPHVYVHQLLLGAMPWTGFLVIATWAAIRRWRRDERVRTLLVWAVVIFLPLCLWGNKQRHYLLPLIPPLMILTAWLIDRALRGGRRFVAFNRVWAAMLVLFVVAAGGMVARMVANREIDAVDSVMAALLLAVPALCFVARRWVSRPASVYVFAGGTMVAMAFGLSMWGESLQPVRSQTIAAAIEARYGSQPLAFVGREQLQLCWHLKRIIPLIGPGEAAPEGPTIGIAMLNARKNEGCPQIDEQMRFNDGDNALYVVGPLRPEAFPLPPEPAR